MNFQNFFQSLLPWFLSHGVKIVLILVVAFLVDQFLKVIIGRAVKKISGNKIEKAGKKRAETLISVFGGTSKFIIWIIALLMVLPEFGINIGALLAGVSLIGLAVGMASREIISDFISGFFIVLEDQYYVGDKVKIAGVEGIVREITLRKTVLEDEAGLLHLIPNGQIKIIAKRKNDVFK